MKCFNRFFASVAVRTSHYCGLCLILFVVIAAPVSADDYLDALNAEVSGSDYLAEAEQEARLMKLDANNVQVLGEIQVAKQSQRNFEDLLLKRYPSTFQIYLKLDSNQKSTAFATFQDSEQLNEASKMILQAYLQ